MADVLLAAGLQELSVLSASNLTAKGTARLKQLTGLHKLSLYGSGGASQEPSSISSDSAVEQQAVTIWKTLGSAGSAVASAGLMANRVITMTNMVH
jgi:hypothetical protein